MTAGTYFVLDSLARSGTTLLSSMLHSQTGIACYRGTFHEPMATEIGLYGQLCPDNWANTVLKPPLIEQEWPVTVEDRVSILDAVRTDGHLLSIFKQTRVCCLLAKYRLWQAYQKEAFNLGSSLLLERTKGVIERENQTGTLSIDEWDDLLSRQPSSIDGIDKLYRELRERHKATALGFRWNQGIAYVNKWLERSDHSWIAILRNPMDRACSYQLAHGVSIEKSLEMSTVFYDKLEQVKNNNRVHILYFEDLIYDPGNELSDLLTFLGETRDDLNLTNLVDQSGEPYQVETADLVKDGKSHKHGQEFVGYDDSSIGRHQDEMSNEVIARYKEAHSPYPLAARYL